MYHTRHERAYPPTWRIVAAFFVAPAAAALLMAIVTPAYDGISDPTERIWRSAYAFAAFGAYPTTLILGVPVFFMMRRFNPNPANCALMGAVIAALPWLLLSMLSLPDSASIDGRATVVNGSLTAYGWLSGLTFVGQIALYSAVGGAVFWLIAAAGRRSSTAK